jgi:hypothetical protein
VLLRYGADRVGLPVFAPGGAERRLGNLVASWGETFDWNAVSDGDKARVGSVDLRFSRTDHPPPTYAVEASAAGRRMIYTADTGPGWSIDAFGSGADLVLSEASYLHDNIPTPIHLSARQAGLAARPGRPGGFGRGRIGSVRRAGHARRTTLDHRDLTSDGRDDHGDP